MEVLHARSAGIDLSKRDAKVCVRILPSGLAILPQTRRSRRTHPDRPSQPLYL